MANNDNRFNVCMLLANFSGNPSAPKFKIRKLLFIFYLLVNL